MQPTGHIRMPHVRHVRCSADRRVISDGRRLSQARQRLRHALHSLDRRLQFCGRFLGLLSQLGRYLLAGEQFGGLLAALLPALAFGDQLT